MSPLRGGKHHRGGAGGLAPPSYVLVKSSKFYGRHFPFHPVYDLIKIEMDMFLKK